VTIHTGIKALVQSRRAELLCVAREGRTFYRWFWVDLPQGGREEVPRAYGLTVGEAERTLYRLYHA